MDKYYKTGEFAKMANLSIRTIRYYDKIGLLKPSKIADNGYRMYSDRDFMNLQKILSLKYLGFSLDAVSYTHLMTVTPVIDKILNWPKELLKHIEFKASFHYLELKKRNLLEIYAKNVQNAWKAGASVNIEITPSDDLIPYIEEVKELDVYKRQI